MFSCKLGRAKRIIAFWNQLSIPIAYAFILAAPVLIAVFIASYGVNIPYEDQWELVPLIRSLLNHSLDLGQLMAQHNEHRILFPRLIMLGLAEETHWNIRAELWFSLALACGYFTYLSLLIRSSFQELGRSFCLWLTVLASWLVFSPVQWENWLWGWQIQWYLLMFCLSGAIYLLWWWPEKWRVVVFFTAISLAFIGSYSMVNGIFIWLVCLPLFWLRGAKPAYWLSWVFIAVVVISFYFYDYVRPANLSSLSVFIQNPWNLVRYISVYLGRGMYFNSDYAVYSFIVLLFIYTISFVYILNLKRIFFPNIIPWVLLSLFSIFSAAMTGVGRVSLGVHQATASRYTTISLMFALTSIIITAVALRFWLQQKKGSNRNRYYLIPVIGVVVIIETISISLVINHSYMEYEYRNRFKIKKCLSQPQFSTRRCLLSTYPDENIVRNRASYLYEIGWGGLKRENQVSLQDYEASLQRISHP